MALTKAQILAADDLPRKQVDVPEWGGSVFVRTMSGTERDAWEMSLVEFREGQRIEHLENVRAKLVAFTAIDESGARLFTDSDVLALGRKSAKALDRVYEAAQELNRLDRRSIEGDLKNSGPGPSGDSTSA
jgi:hypothetical protein